MTVIYVFCGDIKNFINYCIPSGERKWHTPKKTGLVRNSSVILRADRKRNINKTVGIVLAFVSAISLGLGIGTTANPVESRGHKIAYWNSIEELLFDTGGIEGGVEIPLIFVSKKKEKAGSYGW